MKISKLLATRQALLRQAHLANLAYAYMTLQRFSERIGRARLHGLVKLRPADPSEEQFWASLTALEGNQSVLEEHFADHELIELADAMELITEGTFSEVDFRLEELSDKFVTPLRLVLDNAGIVVDVAETQHDLAPGNTD